MRLRCTEYLASNEQNLNIRNEGLNMFEHRCSFLSRFFHSIDVFDEDTQMPTPSSASFRLPGDEIDAS